MRIAATFIILFQLSLCLAQTPAVQRVEPPFWWSGMESSELQLLVYGINIATTTPSLQYIGVTLESVEKVENPNYLFLNLKIDSDAKPGKFPITFASGRRKKVYQYELKARDSNSAERKGFNSSDVV
jgi:hypothetical protein